MPTRISRRLGALRQNLRLRSRCRYEHLLAIGIAEVRLYLYL